MRTSLRRKLMLGCAALAAVFLASCAAQKYHSEGLELFNAGQREQGLALLAQATQASPNNAQYRIDYLTSKGIVVRDLLGRADAARAAGQTAAARELYMAAIRVDTGNERARRGIAQTDTDERHAAIVADAERLHKSGNTAAARDKLRVVLVENPLNNSALALQAAIVQQLEREEEKQRALLAAASVLRRPVTLQFRDANIRMVFEALSRTTGLNVIFDRDVKPDLKTTIFVRDASVEDTVNLILLQNQLDKKVLNANTMFIYPATVAKQKEYQDLKVRTFQISNADAKYMQTVLKGVLKVKEVSFDERTNTLVLRDTYDVIAVAEKVIAAHDTADAEVMLEVELLEVGRDRLSNIGIKWPQQAIISTPPGPNGGDLTLGQLGDLGMNMWLITPLAVEINLRLDDSTTNLLASPRIRTKSKEKARILIGDKVPVITNSVTPMATGAAVVTGTVQYIDVGVKLEVEPMVHLEGDVSIKLNLEVSNIVKEIAGPQGSLAYQIGTRSAQTILRMRDGETQILGGLIQDIDRKTASKVPGLGQLPVLGRIFSSTAGTELKTELVLSITPRIVRQARVADSQMRDVFSGTEANVRETPLRLDPIGPAPGSPQSGIVVPVPAYSLPPAATDAANGSPAAGAAPAPGAVDSGTPAAKPPTPGRAPTVRSRGRPKPQEAPPPAPPSPEEEPPPASEPEKPEQPAPKQPEQPAPKG
jgi:general secretion pathway protein D